GRSPRCIHLYKHRVGYIGNLFKHCYTYYSGDRILVGIREVKKKSILVGLKHQQIPKVPKFDSNNLVLVDNGIPLVYSTKIQVSIPHILRTEMKEQIHSKGDYTKLRAIASRFV
ncbi:39S ribosomal protein L14, mitochondrial, partial [Trachymyrmex septentrionalis]